MPEMQTYLMFMREVLSDFNVSDGEIFSILQNENINPDDTVDIAIAKKAIYDHFSLIVPGILASISEGGYSRSYNIEGLKMFLSAIASELGLPDILAKNSVINKSYIW